MYYRFLQRPAILLGLLTTICLFGVAICGEPSVLRAVSARPSSEDAVELESSESNERLPSDAEPIRLCRCVLLKNGNVLYGAATQVGQFVVIAREDHSEIKLSRKDVACWADSLCDLYAYRVNQRSSSDPDAILRSRINDIGWCLRYELFDLAALELIEVYAVAPEHREAKRLEKRLREAARYAATSVIDVDKGAELERTESTDEKPPLDRASKVFDTIVQSPDGLSDFARYVQPLLINRCAQCHSHLPTSSDRAWRLTTPPTGQRATARMTKENLKATLAHVDFSALAESELLKKAQIAHGNEANGIDPRRASAAATIQEWIASLERTTGHLRFDTIDDGTLDNRSLGQFKTSGEKPKTDSFSADSVSESTSNEPKRPLPEQSETTRNGASESIDHPARLPQISNPFDPELFNRKYAN